MFLRNVGFYKSHAAKHHIKWRSSKKAAAYNVRTKAKLPAAHNESINTSFIGRTDSVLLF
jgi:hypothetical protein